MRSKNKQELDNDHGVGWDGILEWWSVRYGASLLPLSEISESCWLWRYSTVHLGASYLTCSLAGGWIRGCFLLWKYLLCVQEGPFLSASLQGWDVCLWGWGMWVREYGGTCW